MTIQEALMLNGPIPNAGDALSVGLLVTVTGLIIVFAVLVILMCVLVGMKYIFAPKTPKAEKIAEKVEAIPVVSAEKEEDEEELIAVLTAAIAASLNTSTYNLKIKSFKRVTNSAPAWNKAGLSDTINSRF